MMPLRIRFKQILESISSDPTAFRKQVAFVLVLALFGGLVLSDNLSFTLRIGGAGTSEVVATTDSLGGEPGVGQLPTGSVDGTRQAAAAPRKATGSGTDAGEPAATTGADTQQPSEAAPDGGGGGDPGPAPLEWQGACPGGELKATDRGVDEEAIKIGLMTVNLAALEAAGFGLSTGEIDNQQLMDAWVKEFNEHGGVACRKVTYVHIDADLDPDNQIAVCKQFTQDEKVFAVLSPGGNVSGAPCITKDEQTPLITALAAPQRWADEGAPYLWDILMSQERYMRNQIRWLVEAGEVVPGDPDAEGVTRIGVVYADEPYSGPSVESALVGEMDTQGIEPVRVAKLSRDFEQAAAQVPQVVVDFQSAEISHVIMPTNIIYKTQFMQQAEQQNYFPVYSDADYTVGCQNAITAIFPEDSWDGTKCLTAGTLNAAPNGLNPEQFEEYLAGNPFAKYADKVYQAAHPGGYDEGGERNEEDTEAQRNANYLYGTLIMLWAQAADRVGPNLTRPAWGQAMGQTGEFFRSLSPEPFTYGPGKTSGPDFVAVVQWHKDAKDGYEERTYHALVPPFRAYY